MTLRWLMATLHLLALGFGPGAVWVRAGLVMAMVFAVTAMARGYGSETLAR